MSYLRTTLFTVVMLLVLASMALAYNDDRPIYKWSPLWFSRYFRTASMYKRGEEPQIPATECVPESKRCHYWGYKIPCCGLADCIMDYCISMDDQHMFRKEDD